MLAYHNDPEVKAKYVARVKAHIEADELIRGTGFKEGKGCAVGCTLDKYDHSQYPIELGIPIWLACLEDRLFEGMTEEKSKTFPLLFLEAIQPGVDLEAIKSPFLVFIMESTLDKFDHAKFPQVLEVVNRVIKLRKESNPDPKELRKAFDDAVDSEAEADSSADVCYWSANSAYWALCRSASAVARSAREAAFSDAEGVGDSAYWAAEAAFWSAEASAGRKESDRQADYLIELIQGLSS